MNKEEDKTTELEDTDSSSWAFVLSGVHFVNKFPNLIKASAMYKSFKWHLKVELIFKTFTQYIT